MIKHFVVRTVTLNDSTFPQYQPCSISKTLEIVANYSTEQEALRDANLFPNHYVVSIPYAEK